jgi:hypothetical protein
VRFEKARGEAATRRLLERHADEPLTAREIELLRKKMEARRKDESVAQAPASATIAISFSARVEAAFRRDPQAARAELDAVAAKLGLRVVAGGAVSLPGD